MLVLNRCQGQPGTLGTSQADLQASSQILLELGFAIAGNHLETSTETSIAVSFQVRRGIANTAIPATPAKQSACRLIIRS